MDTTWQPGMTLEQLEKQVILHAYSFYGMNKAKTAQALGIAYRTIRYKLTSYGVKSDETEDDGENSEQGVCVEPSKEVSAKQSVPVRQQEKIQEMPPRHAPGRSARVSR